MLKVLDSPKPPSPALYFKRRNGQGAYISKSELKLESHAPQGRKFYLHRRGNTGEPWKTSPEAANENLAQKSRVQPIKAGLTFYFHIDFDNLSRGELGLLCYAVRPTEQFRHKVGMGKALGLGKVRIDPVGLFYVDRLARYRETSLFDARRYHGRWIPATEDVQDWPATYAREQEALTPGSDTFPAFEPLRQDFRNSMDADIRQALELLGDPSNVRHPVHTPQVAGASGPELESETYRWFVANDIGSGRGADRIRPEFLKPLNAASTDLPTLSEHPWDA